MVQSNAAAYPAGSAASRSSNGAASSAGAAGAIVSAEASLDSGAELASAYCPRCSARLAPRSCKLICPGCGYYMSCSDFI